MIDTYFRWWNWLLIDIQIFSLGRAFVCWAAKVTIGLPTIGSIDCQISINTVSILNCFAYETSSLIGLARPLLKSHEMVYMIGSERNRSSYP